MPNVEDILASQGEAKQNASTQDDLRKEIERLRMEVEMASRSIVIDENDCPVESLIPPYVLNVMNGREHTNRRMFVSHEIVLAVHAHRWVIAISYRSIVYLQLTFLVAHGVVILLVKLFLDVLIYCLCCCHYTGCSQRREAIAKGFNSPEDFTIKDGSLRYSDGSSYEGERLGALRHGKGTYTRADGATYKGEWRYDVLEGHARAVMPDGQTYDGPWKEGRACGRGRATYQGGAVYEGDFENDGRHGWGIQTFPTGDTYEGEWFQDKIHGKNIARSGM